MAKLSGSSTTGSDTRRYSRGAPPAERQEVLQLDVTRQASASTPGRSRRPARALCICRRTSARIAAGVPGAFSRGRSPGRRRRRRPILTAVAPLQVVDVHRLRLDRVECVDAERRSGRRAPASSRPSECMMKGNPARMGDTGQLLDPRGRSAGAGPAARPSRPFGVAPGHRRTRPRPTPGILTTRRITAALDLARPAPRVACHELRGRRPASQAEALVAHQHPGAGEDAARRPVMMPRPGGSTCAASTHVATRRPLPGRAAGDACPCPRAVLHRSRAVGADRLRVRRDGVEPNERGGAGGDHRRRAGVVVVRAQIDEVEARQLAWERDRGRAMERTGRPMNFSIISRCPPGSRPAAPGRVPRGRVLFSRRR